MELLTHVSMTFIDVLGAASYPNVDWEVPVALQRASSKIAFALALIWMVYIIGQMVWPSRRGGGGRIQWGKLFLVGIAIVYLLDLSLIAGTVNNILKWIWQIGNMFGVVS